MNTLSIHLFGRMRVGFAGTPSEISIPPSARSLLAYLLLQPHRFYAREILFDICWGDRPENQARDCLNTALWRLRRALEKDKISKGAYLVTTQAGEIGFNWGCAHWLDLETFDGYTRHFLGVPAAGLEPEHVQAVETVLPLYEGDLLEGFYDDWALRERERLRLVYLDCLDRLMRYYYKRGAYEQSLHFGRSILRLDPLREDIHREIMRLYSQTGQRTLSVSQYKLCSELLTAELGISPMPETETLLAQIMAGEPVTHPEPVKPRRLPPSGDRCPAISEEARLLLEHAMQRLSAAREELTGAMQLIEQFSTGRQDERPGPKQGKNNFL